MTIRQQERLIRKAIDDLKLGRFATIEKDSKHFKVELRNDDKKAMVTVSKTPGEYRSNLNFRSTLRRVASSIGCFQEGVMA